MKLMSTYQERRDSNEIFGSPSKRSPKVSGHNLDDSLDERESLTQLKRDLGASLVKTLMKKLESARAQ